MNIIFNILIFLIGITFGSFYTLAVHRIPRGEDIIYTHSYCPKCKNKLQFLDLIPVFSYIFLKGKCRYCKEKIRPRYFILEIISGLFFVVLANLLKLNIYNIKLISVIEYGFFILYFTFAILIAGIDKEYRKINKPVLMYGILISIMYIIYLYIIEKTSIYRYVIYLALFLILLIFDTIKLKKEANNNYTYAILLLLLIMSVFTGEYIVIASIITTLIIVSIYLLISKLKKKKNKKINAQFANQIKLGLILIITNITYCIIILMFLSYKGG